MPAAGMIRMKMDLAYIDTCPLVPCNGRRDWSLWLDFKIILRIIKVVLLGEGR